MCGIAGFLERAGERGREDLGRTVQAMADALRHRGPDAGGIWVDECVGAAFGHRRLSIIDLSPKGAQPMLSLSERYVITFNGEIYNFQALRTTLESRGVAFRGHSDTEVLLAAVETFGLRAALEQIEGMFAFALWDRKNRMLTLARDRVGKKPLYYGWSGKILLFGSELKALWQHPGFDDMIDRDCLGEFVRYGWLPEPLSIYQSVRKLPPGSFLEIPFDTSPWSVEPIVFWSAKQQVESGRRELFAGDYSQAVEQLDRLLCDSVGSRMVADVELGALLSGGIDSTTVVALMQSVAEQPVKTFSVGFWEPKFNEATFAKEIAGHLKTDHHELYVQPEDCLAVVEDLPRIYDEPFADVSQVPTTLVARLARREVKVALTGDGGDELFAGYRHYSECLARWRSLSGKPLWLRRLAGSALAYAGRQSWHLVKPRDGLADAKLGGRKRQGARLERAARSWSGASPQEVLALHWARCADPARIVLGTRGTPHTMSAAAGWAEIDEPLHAMLHLDFIGYLPGDILVKVDRATMAVGLEARCPILDHKVAEFAWRLPDHFLRDRSGGKRILKDVLARYVPREMTDRPKKGFGVPLDDWLRGPLRPWVEDLIGGQALGNQGYFEPAEVKTIWRQHLCKWRNQTNLLWAILMFQSWLDNEKTQPVETLSREAWSQEPAA